MKVGVIRERLLQRVSEVLRDGSTEDVFIVADQLRVVAGSLAAAAPDEEVDLSTATVDTAQAARMLGYHAEHVRRLIRQNTIRATKVGADYRIPLSELLTILVKRHREDAIADLLPSERVEMPTEPSVGNGAVELAIDVSLTWGNERRPLRSQRFSIELQDWLRGQGARPAGAELGEAPDL